MRQQHDSTRLLQRATIRIQSRPADFAMMVPVYAAMFDHHIGGSNHERTRSFQCGD
jgi:hypothetical protein